MIASLVNDYVWTELTKDAALSEKYNAYRTQYGNSFKPFFPVFDDHAGDISWGSECYVLWDSMVSRPTRNVYSERHEQVLYTIVGPIPDVFEFKDRIVNLFDYWDSTAFSTSGYKVNDIDVWQPDRTRGRDKLRQTYSISLILDVHYIPC